MNRLNANRPPLRWLITFLALTLGLAAEQALADGPGDAKSVQVRFADLDLSKQAGAEALYRRIQGAARLVCGRVDQREVQRYRMARQCYEETIDAAIKKVDLSTLYAVHDRESGPRAPDEALAASTR